MPHVTHLSPTQFTHIRYFADQPLVARFMAPNYPPTTPSPGAILTSGQFDIGKWFRTLNVEIQLYGNKGELHFKKDEPIFYVNFLTDRKVILKRFELTKDRLHRPESPGPR